MTPNDGHVFCPAERVGQEIEDILQMVTEAYSSLDIPSPRLRLSRAGDGDQYVADPELRRENEQLLRDVLHRVGAPFTEAEGEAAFDGPKLDLQVTDPQGREETL